jgi:cell division protein FtsB
MLEKGLSVKNLLFSVLILFSTIVFATEKNQTKEMSQEDKKWIEEYLKVEEETKKLKKENEKLDKLNKTLDELTNMVKPKK